MTDMQRIRAEALWVAAEVFGKTGYDAEFVIHKADTVFLPYILNGREEQKEQA